MSYALQIGLSSARHSHGHEHIHEHGYVHKHKQEDEKNTVTNKDTTTVQNRYQPEHTANTMLHKYGRYHHHESEPGHKPNHKAEPQP